MSQSMVAMAKSVAGLAQGPALGIFNSFVIGSVAEFRLATTHADALYSDK
jgi:hypothetical protein